eukprot:3826817-Lingulodinium_polyedra.AAC.1
MPGGCWGGSHHLVRQPGAERGDGILAGPLPPPRNSPSAGGGRWEPAAVEARRICRRGLSLHLPWPRRQVGP